MKAGHSSCLPSGNLYYLAKRYQKYPKTSSVNIFCISPGIPTHWHEEASVYFSSLLILCINKQWNRFPRWILTSLKNKQTKKIVKSNNKPKVPFICTDVSKTLECSEVSFKNFSNFLMQQKELDFFFFFNVIKKWDSHLRSFGNSITTCMGKFSS